jgi:hypothetical protein
VGVPDKRLSLRIASVFPKVHGGISEALWPNHHVFILAKQVLRANLIYRAVD